MKIKIVCDCGAALEFNENMLSAMVSDVTCSNCGKSLPCTTSSNIKAILTAYGNLTAANVKVKSIKL